MRMTNPVLERLQEERRVNKVFLKVLEGYTRHSDDLMFVDSCMKNLIEETKKQAVTTKQYIDHIRGAATLQPKSMGLTSV